MGKGRERERRKAARDDGGSGAGFLVATLAAEGERIARREQGHLAARLLRAAGGRVEVIDARALQGAFGWQGVAGAAAVLRRVSDAVGLVLPARPVGAPGSIANQRGIAAGWVALVVARAPGVVRAHRLHGVPQKGGGFKVDREELTHEELARMGDFADPGFPVEPALDDHLASAGIPGAVRRAAPAPGDAHMPPPPDRRDAAPAARRVPRLDTPWETARDASDELTGLSPGLGGAELLLVPGSAPPAGLADQPIDDLVRALASSEERSVHLLSRVPLGVDAPRFLDAIEAAGAPATAVLLCTARATWRAARDLRDYQPLAERLVAGLERLTGGDAVGWLRGRWPLREADGAASSCWVALVAVGGFWDVVLAQCAVNRATALPAALERAEALRDALLDLSDVPAGGPGGRVVAAMARTMEGPGDRLGETRERPLLAALRSLALSASPLVRLDAFASWYAANLHTVAAVGRLDLWQRGMAGGTSPADLPLGGLLGRGREVVASHLVLFAIQADQGDPSVPAALEAVVEAAPWSVTHRRVANEGRFAVGVRSAALLASLRIEDREGSVGTAAEGLAVAEALEDREAARVFARRLRERARGTSLEPVVEARLAVRRPELLQDGEAISRILAGLDGAALPDGRVGRALLGDARTETLDAWRRTLLAQREALEWAALVEACRADTPTAPRPDRPGRPACPAEPGDGALDAAHRALRWRLDRPGLAAHPAKGLLEEHARAALRLVATGDAAAGAAWLRAVGGDGLVAALDEALRGEGDPLPALEAARAALAESLDALWLGGVLRALDAVRGAADPAIQRERAAIEAALGGDRDDVERRVSVLLERASRAPEPARYDEPAERGAPFTPMRVPQEALDRSRRSLGTPEWAIGEGLRQVVLYNRTLGRRDLKMLRGTRTEDRGALWELRHRDGRNPVRVLYRLTPDGPVVVALLAKEDDAQQARALAVVREWA